jgi:hypothetical protein
MKTLLELIDRLGAASATTWLALWGAFTGTVAWLITVHNYLRDRARLLIRVSPFSEEEVRRIDDSLIYAGGKQYLLVDVANAGRRKTTIYQPEMWCVNKLGLLEFESPRNVLRGETWEQIANPWAVYFLHEGDSLTFLFRLADEDKFARIDLADTLARFAHYRTVLGTIRWWRAWAKGGRQWKNLRNAFFERHRPRHHKND